MASLPPPERLRATARRAQKEKEGREAWVEDQRQAALVRAADLRRSILTAAVKGEKTVTFDVVSSDFIRSLQSEGFSVGVEERIGEGASGWVSWRNAKTNADKALACFSAASMAWISSDDGQKFFEQLAHGFEAAATQGKTGARFRVLQPSEGAHTVAGKMSPAPRLLLEVLDALGYKAQVTMDAGGETCVAIRWGLRRPRADT